MKRIGNLFESIISLDNLIEAEKKARKGKSNQYGVQTFDKNSEASLVFLHETLANGDFKTSKYTTFKVYEPKERLVFKLPYYPDRIVHHAIMNVMERIFVSLFTADTYSCIKGRGIHAALRNLKSALQDKSSTKYCLKLDIVKFYPNVNHEILKQQLRRKIKDNQLLMMLDEIIDSADGLPIGNYLSQYFANFYLTGFDHWIKETKSVKHYFRYADDIVILAPTKEELHQLQREISMYLQTHLKLSVKNNYQVFLVEDRGIDFVGYVFRHNHILLRKSIKKRFAKAVSRNANNATIASYLGWAKHCNSKNLIKKILNANNYKNIQTTRN